MFKRIRTLYKIICWRIATGRWPRKFRLTAKGLEWARAIKHEGATIKTGPDGSLILVRPDEAAIFARYTYHSDPLVDYSAAYTFWTSTNRLSGYGLAGWMLTEPLCQQAHEIARDNAHLIPGWMA